MRHLLTVLIAFLVPMVALAAGGSVQSTALTTGTYLTTGGLSNPVRTYSVNPFVIETDSAAQYTQRTPMAQANYLAIEYTWAADDTASDGTLVVQGSSTGTTWKDLATITLAGTSGSAITTLTLPACLFLRGKMVGDTGATVTYTEMFLNAR